MEESMLAARPKLRRGCRLSPNASDDQVLLIPEGVLRLTGPGRRILELCDGNRTTAEIVSALEAQFPTTEEGRIGREVEAFLRQLKIKGAVEFG